MRVVHFFTDTVFRRPPESYRSPVMRRIAARYLRSRWCQLLFYTLRETIEHGTMVRSAALTFYTLMALVPIAAVAFAVVKGFGQAEALLENLYELFPQAPETIDYVVGSAQRALARTQGGLVAAVALVMLFWSVVKVFSSIESAFNNIWEVNQGRSVGRRISYYVAVVVIGPLLWVVIHAVVVYAQSFAGGGDSPGAQLLAHAVSLPVTWAMFTYLYMALPSVRVRVRNALVAGVVAGTFFLLFQWGYVWVQRWMTSYNAIYGSFAALPLLLIWMQGSWRILLFGGELSYACQNIGSFAEERESLLLTEGQRRRLLLAALLVVSERFRNGAGPTGVGELCGRLGVTRRVAGDVLGRLVEAKLLLVALDPEGGLTEACLPSHCPETLTLRGAIAALESVGTEWGKRRSRYGGEAEEAAVELPASAELERVVQVLGRRDAVAETAGADPTIEELIR